MDFRATATSLLLLKFLKSARRTRGITLNRRSITVPPSTSQPGPHRQLMATRGYEDRRTAMLRGRRPHGVGALFRFYGLAWGAPYFHFHQDEHFVLSSADMLRPDPSVAAMSPKFFMYAPLLPYLINIVRSTYETIAHP
jgi:hypothetical protein